MMNGILNKMDADELRALAKHQADAISAYQAMVFTKDELIGAFERLYQRRVDMEEARICYEVKIANLRWFDDNMAEKYGDPPVCNCEAEGMVARDEIG